MIKLISLALAVGVWTFIAFILKELTFHIPSSYIALMMMTNTIFAFFSIFVQRLVIVLYEVNVFEEPKSIPGYFFKYIAICHIWCKLLCSECVKPAPFYFE